MSTVNYLLQKDSCKEPYDCLANDGFRADQRTVDLATLSLGLTITRAHLGKRMEDQPKWRIWTVKSESTPFRRPMID